MKKRIALLLYVSVDPRQVDEETGEPLSDIKIEDMARAEITDLLEAELTKYNPVVAHAPESLQPNNPKFNGEPTKRDIRKVQASPHNSGEIPQYDEYLPQAGPSHLTTPVNTADVAMTYNEGNA